MTINSRTNPFEFSEADTCREYVTPVIQATSWGYSPFEIAEQSSFTDDRLVLSDHNASVRKGKCVRHLNLEGH